MRHKKRHLVALLLCLVSISLPPTAEVAAEAAAVTKDNGVCSLGKTAWNPGARARFGLSMSLRKGLDRVRGCGMVSQEVLQIYVAAQWVCDLLNADHGNGSFVPGVQFGFDLLDDCRSPTRAVQYALDYVDLYSDYCNLPDNSTDAASQTLRIGLVGPSRSSTAEETADATRSIHMPIISPSATLASLTQGDTPHPNFFRTVPSDKLQIKTIVAILKQLRWTFLVVLYTDDNYGAAGSRLLQEQARASNICINDSIPIKTHTPLDTVVSRLLRTHQTTEGESMAVVYIGEKDKAENIIFNLRSREASGLHFIMSDSVSTNTDVFESGRLESGLNIALGSLTLAPSSVVLQDFEKYLNEKYRDVKAGKVQDDVIKAFLEESKLSRPSETLPSFKQISFVPLAVSAIFALAEATRRAQQDRCGAGATEVCPALVAGVRDGDILTHLRNLQVDYEAMDSSRAPKELKAVGYVLEFDDNGDVVPKPELPDYTVFAYDDDSKKPFQQVGTYSGEKLTLDMSSVRTLNKNRQETSVLPTSVCAGSCPKCADNGKVPTAHVNGTAYIIGIFSLHERNADQPFKCGDFRNVSNDAVVVEAFLHAVEQLKRKTGINFGAVAFDDCYSKLHITSILSDFLSGLVPYDKGLFEVCVPQDEVVGVVGSLSSDSTLAVASFSSPQRIPTISYAASSPDLDDTVNYPYFLRTVPSDEEQATAMTELIKAMGWEYVGLLYVANNYGTKGALAFKRVANQHGVCVATPVAISVNPTNVDEKHLYDAFVSLMQQSVKVVVFFGIDTRMADFLRLIESRNEQGRLVFIASEEWGTKNDVLAAGQKAARGSITFKVDNTYIEPAIEDTLRTRLLEKTPREDDVNPWFSEFWQHVFDCNIPGGFNNIFTRNCDSNTRLSTQQVLTMLSDQRVKHVMNAVGAMASGLAQAGSQFCEDTFPCPFLRSDKYAKEVLDTIKSQTVSVGSNKEQLFDQNGNGNIGFSIFNIQRRGDGYEYVPVGTYSKKNGLHITQDNFRFYTDTGLPQEQLEAACSGDLCSAPECVKTPEVLPTPAPEVTTDKDFRVADMAILIVTVALFLLLICCLCLGFKYFRQKVRTLTKDLQETKNEPMYVDVGHSPRHTPYSNMGPGQRGVLTLPLTHSSSSPSSSMPPARIQFVNAGLSTASNSPGNTLDGRTNPAFIPDSAARKTPTASETSLTPTHRHRGSPPPPPLPNRSPAPPPFHHIMSTAPDDKGNWTDPASSHHSYYMTHSMSSHRELPPPPTSTGGGVQSSTRSLRSFQSCPDGSQQERMENIPMQDLSPGSYPFQQQGDPRYLHSTETDQSMVGSHPSQGDDIQYFRMTPSGELEEQDEENTEVLRTYSLSPPEEDRSTLDTYSLSPQTSRAAPQYQASPSRQSPGTPQYQASPSRQSPGTPQRERSESLSPTQYTGDVPSQDRSLTPNNNFPGFIQPLRITPDMRDMILRQILLESMSPAQHEMGYRPGSAEAYPSSFASSANSAASPGPRQPNNVDYRPQRSHPASAHYPSSDGPASVAASPGHSYPRTGSGQQMNLTPASSPEGQSAQTLHTGVYAPVVQLPQFSGDSQLSRVPDLPQTDLSSPYAQLAQGQASAPHTPPVSVRGVEGSRSAVAASDSSSANTGPITLQQISPQLPQQQMQPQPQPQQYPHPQPQEGLPQYQGQQEQPSAQQLGEENKLVTLYGMNISNV
ncbi:uncharacterized protein LOC143284661 [Babylonia areolata]|uniref:uncharacterized protein LOC143284661 n=1 Tax=Babylonia areolata TaxID=304850 RepID=UPI003FD3A1AA